MIKKALRLSKLRMVSPNFFGHLVRVLSSFFVCSQLYAEPSWIGAYGDIVRHDGGNPGVYSVSLNSHYYDSLAVEVGYQVNGGPWQVMAMKLSRNLENGDSVWTLRPTERFETGTTINYYFHAYDGWRVSLFDNNGGGNYSIHYKASNVITFHPPAQVTLDYPANYAEQDLVVTDAGILLSSSGEHQFSQLLDNDLITQSSVDLSASISPKQVQLQASAHMGDLVVQAFSTENKIYIRRSTDGGRTYLPDVAVLALEAYLTELELAAKGESGFEIAAVTQGGSPALDKVWSLGSKDGGANWRSPLLVYQSASIGQIRYDFLLRVSEQASFILFSDASSSLQGDLKIARSFDGNNWHVENLFTGRLPKKFALSVNGDNVVAALDVDQDVRTLIWHNQGNGTWQSSAIAHPYESNQDIYLQHLYLNDMLLIRGRGQNTQYRTSVDGGLTWGESMPIENYPATHYLSQLRVKDGTLYLLYSAGFDMPQVQTASLYAPPQNQSGRTMVFIYGQTKPGQDMFLRGGIDFDYARKHLGRICTQENGLCAIPLVHRQFTGHPQRANDTELDWHGAEPGQGNVEGSPLVWTTNNPNHPHTVEKDGFGFSPLNQWGEHYWLLDVDMDCTGTVDGWFELKSYISNGPGWEKDIRQQGGPYSSINHFARCGHLNVFRRGESSAIISPINQ